MLFTKSQLRTSSNYYEMANESIYKNSLQNSFDIFLSHSYKDKEYIIGLKQLLENYGYSVYVDWIVDSHLNRSKINKDTAEQIRKRMNQCKCLFYATSDNSPDSKWMPWELGYFDGYNGKVAIVPISDVTTSTFSGQEYLSLYPYVDEAFTQEKTKKKLWLNEGSNASSLENWLGLSRV